MERMSTYRIPVTVAALHAAVTEPVLPAALLEPLQSLVAAVSHRCAESPCAVYICADDDASGVRDDVAFLLARALSAHIPSALLVDCDFVAVGLHGLVPQKDALGFLDFLLYGSSLGVITQETHGARVVGSGSFPVTRRMPFVETAFADAARRLVAHARCAIFVGPARDETGQPHPIAGAVDVVAAVTAGGRSDTAETLVALASEVWTIELNAPAPPPPPSVPASAPAPAEPRFERPAAPAAPASARALEAGGRYASLGPRIAISVFGLIVIVFAVWWFTQGRGRGLEPVSEPVAALPTGGEPAPAHPGPDTTRSVFADSVRADTSTAPLLSPPRDTLRTRAQPPTNFADTGGRTGGTQLISPADIHVMADLEVRWKDWYVIHISSFQESIRAREEVAFLQSREFPVFIVFLDLGAKGKWYRVYSGPFQTREEAREVKKNLDAVPQVRFTRITKIPE
ncbi:MAG TPA: SPOR domain-containing protein [Candidatus Krumholzibacteria bacterium]|nr:SPOR domain-containing protein [Candidatus Krumholzibacteria bacterium]